jgi:soluble lytic murein transglycosylase-like protein
MKATHWALALIPLLLAGCATPPDSSGIVEAQASQDALSERISHYADVYGVPESVIRSSIQRESGFNPNRRAGPYWGLMQLRLDTARSMGYTGPARGLLDANTNLNYGVAYLSNAYLVAGGNPKRALGLYARGYYFEARRKGLLDQLKTAHGAEPGG